MTTKRITDASNLFNQKLVNDDAIYVIKKLQQNKFDGYIVGGGIRDLLLGKQPKDFDIVTNATPEQVRRIFRRNSIIIGKRFKIVHIIFNNINPEKMINNRPVIYRHILEISTYRSAQVHNDNINEHGRIMTDNNYGNQKEDASRRDFSINSLYYNPINKQIIDYHNGIEDLSNRSLRIIGEPILRYTEDPVRILRAIRLATKLDLNIENATLKAIHLTKHLLQNENKSRLYEEMLKILLSGASYACITKLKQFKIPLQVFTLFDKLFFTDKEDSYAVKILEKTDERLKTTSDVSISFILCGLLWSSIKYKRDKLNQSRQYNSYQALSLAIELTQEFALQIGVTKQLYANMKDVWLLQHPLEIPTKREIKHALNNSRFRQAWHLFGVRYELGEIDKELYQQLDELVLADKPQQQQILNSLPNSDLINETDDITAIKAPRKRSRNYSRSRNKL